MAGPTTDKTGQIQTTSNGPDKSLAGWLAKMGPELQRAVPKHVTADRLARVALTALRTTRDLALCTPESFLGCVMQTAQLGLEPNTPLGHAYLIPRRNKRLQGNQRECTLIIGYQGYIELARRSGMVSSIYAYTVREGDDFGYKLGLSPDIHHVPSEDPERENKPITHVYAVAAMRDSTERVFVVLTKAQIEKARSRSDAADSEWGPWQREYESMALKTAIRRLWKWLPKSTELQRAEAIENANDQGASIGTALDSDVGDMLARHGLVEDAQIVETAPAGATATAEASPATKQ